METVVELQVRNVDLDNEQVLERLDELENASFGYRCGLTIMTVYVDEGKDVVHTVTDAAHHLAVKVEGAAAVRVDPDLVTISDIAQRVGVSREAVRKWTLSERTPFPIPFSSTGKSQKLWRWVEIAEWLQIAKHIDMDEDLPTSNDAAAIDACLAKVPDAFATEWEKLSSSPTRTSVIEPQRRPKTVVKIYSFEDHSEDRAGRASTTWGVENVG